jgi:hypothetical protein
MEQPYRRIGNIAAKVYAVLVLLCGLAFLVLAFILSGAMHVSESAPYFFFPGLVFVVLGVFIWREAAWAMILTAVSALGLILFILHDDPSILIFLAAPAVFGILTAVCMVCRIKARSA